MKRFEAIPVARDYAQELGFGVLGEGTARRGKSWWVVSFKDSGPDLGMVVVEDNGDTHVEPVPFGPWFEDLEPV